MLCRRGWVFMVVGSSRLTLPSRHEPFCCLSVWLPWVLPLWRYFKALFSTVCVVIFQCSGTEHGTPHCGLRPIAAPFLNMLVPENPFRGHGPSISCIASVPQEALGKRGTQYWESCSDLCTNLSCFAIKWMPGTASHNYVNAIAFFLWNQTYLGWECSSVVECVLSLCKDLGSIASSLPPQEPQQTNTSKIKYNRSLS